MRLVIIESPYAGDVNRNINYLQKAIRDSLDFGESPYASHQMLTQALDDTDDTQRMWGITAGLAWADKADYVVVYADHGISTGMRLAIQEHVNKGREVKVRFIFDVHSAEYMNSMLQIVKCIQATGRVYT